MKILEINKFNYPKGGADRHFLDLAKLFKSRGDEVAVFSMENSQNHFSPWKKYFVSYVGYGEKDSLWQKIKGVFRMFYSFEAKRKIRKILNDFQPDIVHIHNIYHQISPAILTEIKKRGIPIVMTVHDYKLVCPNYLLNKSGEVEKEFNFWKFIREKGFKNSYGKSFLVALEFKFHKYLDIYEKNIDLYISPSAFTKRKLIEGGIPEDKIKILPHFFIENKYGEKYFLNLKEKYAFHFGRLSKDKGVENLIKMFEKIPEIKLYLAGEIEDDLKIPERENIKYLGFLNQRELKRYIKNSLFVISLSELPETFGLVALEAIANGKPFLGKNSGAFSEIIQNNKEGFICESEEALIEKIKEISKDEGLRILLGRNALEKSKKFNSEEYYNNIKSLFGKLTSCKLNDTIQGQISKQNLA